ncbi:DUF6884 domain-containing protein [uncultured Abyssibacter sp.]|uniref:DUF6884 domain-containing protein n=1 Tax=uncultured Abyssibacter sp. TaxID=2320202 RepID=UPI0032B16723|tara:strand:- start:268 stop:1464 length:1197 start_codon:yes stop_codon:yes gene_type:complete
MSDIALISCVKTKAPVTTRTLELYRSPLFRKSLLHALRRRFNLYVLSAEHGILAPENIVTPYEKTLKEMSADQTRVWAAKVGIELRRLVRAKDTIHLYAGKTYSRPLLPELMDIGCRVNFPISGSLGQRLAHLKNENREDLLWSQLAEFKKITRRLTKGTNQGIRLKDLISNKLELPRRGIYIFVDPTEPDQSHLGGRITRIGTHAISAAAKSTLINRLRTHLGPRSGIGSHRSSIFRLHTGNAFKISDPDRWTIESWAIGSTAPKRIREKEAPLENAVSEYIGAHLVYWLDIDDSPSPISDRAFLESNIIGLLSSAQILQPTASASWLGTQSQEYRIALSGLWNLDHLFVQPHDKFIQIYQRHVDATLKGRPLGALAPTSWRSEMKNKAPDKQLELL